MANTETVKVNIATVGTQQAVKDTKSLKQQIKELREELVNLDKSTDEYNQKIQELGNLMHQQQEITEQARIATDDYGQTLNNLSTVASGVVGSITAVQGVMGLLGEENEDAAKTIKTMTSLMGILQGLSALEKFEKTMGQMLQSMKKLTTQTQKENVSMKVNTVEAGKNATAMAGAAAATKAQGTSASFATKSVNLLSVGFKNLGTAIKSFMMSNPFTLILLAATALITAISNVISKTKEAEEEMKRMKYESELAASEILKVYGTTGESDEQKRDRGQRSFNYNEAVQLKGNEQEIKNLKQLEINLQTAKTTIEQYGKAIISTGQAEEIFARTSVKDINDINQVTQALLETRKKLNSVQYLEYDEKRVKAQGELNILQEEYNKLSDIEKKNHKGDTKKKEEEIKNQQQIVDNYRNNANAVLEAIADIEDAEATRAKNQRKDEEAKKKQDAANRKQLQAENLKAIQDEYNKEKTETDNKYKAGLISAEAYYNKLKEIENKYIQIYKDRKKEIGYNDTQIAIQEEAYANRIIEINKNLNAELQRICKEQNDLETQIKENNLKLETEMAEETLRRSQQDQQALAGNDNYYEREFEFAEAWIGKKLELIQQAEDQQYQIEYEANQKHLELQIERLQKDMEFAQQQKEMNDWNEDLTYGNNVEQLQMQKEAELQIMQTYAEQKKATEEEIAQRRAEIEEEYDTKLEQLRIQHLQNLRQIENDYIAERADNEYQLSEYIYQLHENEYNHEVEMFQKKQQLTKSYLSSFSTMVGGVQGLLSELQGSYEEGSKEYENIERANIILSGITGALQAWQSGMAAAPAPWNLAIAAAMSGISVATTIAALANLKNKKLSTSASNASLNITPYETVATETGAELNGQIADTRVYVVEEDIADTARRVYVAESEASF